MGIIIIIIINIIIIIITTIVTSQGGVHGLPPILWVGSSVDATRHAGGCEGARARVSYTMLFSTDDLFAFYLSCFSCTVWEAVAIYTCLARYPST